MRRMLLSATLVATFVLVGSGSASALTGSPTNIATPFASGPPAVAVQASGNALIAWANTKDLAGANNFVQWCVLPPGATACSQSGNLQPADSGQYIDGLSVLDEGPAGLVILADVFGTSGANGVNPTDYEQVQEWQSTDGGQTFATVNAGKAVASGDPSNDTQPLNGVTLPGGGALGFAFNTAGAFPTFHAFSLAAPTSCGRADNACPDRYATLEPSTNPDTITNAGGNFAANASGVMGIFNTNFTSGPLGCSNAQTVPFGTAFVYGTGAQSPSNNYNVSPGQPNTAWRVAATQADCNVDYPAVGAGPSGFGVLETNELTKQTIFHRFDESTASFDTPAVTVSSQTEQQPAVSQDGTGGVYATYLSGGAGGPVSLSYSFDGGTTWSGPATLAASTSTGISQLTSNVNASGQGWAAWTDNGSVFAQRFQAADAVAPAAPTTITTSQTAGATTGASISVPQGTLGMTDTATIAGANAAGATGTMTYTLYSSAACTPSSAIATSTETVAAGVAPPSAPVTALLAPGKYYWQAVYSGNAGSVLGAKGNQPSSSACGSEELAIGEPNSVAASATSDGTTVSISVSCATFPCTITLTLTATETVVIKTGERVAEKKTKTRKRTITLGKAAFRLKHKGKVAVKLSKTGRTFLAKKRGKVKLGLALSEKLAGHAVVTKHTLTVKVTHPKRNKKK